MQFVNLLISFISKGDLNDGWQPIMMTSQMLLYFLSKIISLAANHIIGYQTMFIANQNFIDCMKITLSSHKSRFLFWVPTHSSLGAWNKAMFRFFLSRDTGLENTFECLMKDYTAWKSSYADVLMMIDCDNDVDDRRWWW